MKKDLYVRAVPELKEKLQALAKETGQSVNALIVSACWELVNKHKAM